MFVLLRLALTSVFEAKGYGTNSHLKVTNLELSIEKIELSMEMSTAEIHCCAGKL